MNSKLNQIIIPTALQTCIQHFTMPLHASCTDNLEHFCTMQKSGCGLVQVLTGENLLCSWRITTHFQAGLRSALWILLYLKFTLSRREIDKRMCLGEEERLMVRKRQQNYSILLFNYISILCSLPRLPHVCFLWLFWAILVF